MYYKIVNQESEIYKKMLDLRQYEIQADIDNVNEIKSRTGLDFNSFLGQHGQQNFNRTTSYMGFKFLNPDMVDRKVWKLHKKHPNIFVPNKRTKVGRDMDNFLSHELKCSSLFSLLEILKLQTIPKFQFPYLEIVDNILIMSLDDRFNFKNDDVIEITSKEFNELLNMNK